MKTTLFLAMSLDGFIAKPDDSVTWSEEVWNNYGSFCSEVGNLIVGRRTFELMKTGGDFEKLTLKNLVVVSASRTSDDAGAAIFVRSPRDAVAYFEGLGATHAIVGGGRILAQSFLSENLLTEIQLDVEPQIYGAGVPLFGEIEHQTQLSLIDVKKSGVSTVRLHYRVNATKMET